LLPKTPKPHYNLKIRKKNIFDVKDYDVPLKVKYFTPGLTDSTWFWYSSLGIKVYTGFNSDPFFQLDIDGLKL